MLRSRVVDRDGRRLGPIIDVRLVRDGPVIEGFGPPPRVDGIVVGRPALALKLGYHRQGVQGPALVRRLAVALERRRSTPGGPTWSPGTATSSGCAGRRVSCALTDLD